MACNDLVVKDLRCSRGMPIAPLFRYYFCETKPEKCPFLLWEKSPTSDSMIKGKRLSLNPRRFI